MTDTLSFQCLLRQDGTHIVAWIEARGARTGARVELKDETGLWDVVEVYQPARTVRWLQNNASRAHRGMPDVVRSQAGWVPER